MKLIFAIVSTDDGNKALKKLNAQGFGATKFATSGGFLREKNMTLILGTEEERIPEVMRIFKENCRKRTKVAIESINASMTGFSGFAPIEIEVGGATIFIVNVESFEKI